MCFYVSSASVLSAQSLELPAIIKAEARLRSTKSESKSGHILFYAAVIVISPSYTERIADRADAMRYANSTWEPTSFQFSEGEMGKLS